MEIKYDGLPPKAKFASVGVEYPEPIPERVTLTFFPDESDRSRRLCIAIGPEDAQDLLNQLTQFLPKRRD